MSEVLVNFEVEEIQNKIKKAANWFYWIAALSIINSILNFDTPSNIGFTAALGISQIVDGFIMDLYGSYHYYATIINVLISLVIAVIGYNARKANKTAFIIGLNVYALDGILFFYYNIWINFAFHILVLYFIYQGIPAINELKKLDLDSSLKMQNFKSDN